jgi:hypothetical protein
VSWYLRSASDHDTHQGTMSRGSVIAACGIRFPPRTIAFGRKALSGTPCQECAAVAGSGHRLRDLAHQEDDQ